MFSEEISGHCRSLDVLSLLLLLSLRIVHSRTRWAQFGPYCSLTGPLPPMPVMTALTRLTMPGCPIGGTFPTVISTLPNLVYVVAYVLADLLLTWGAFCSP